MKVGVVIISYNNEKHLEAAIESVQNQTLTNWTCVMVDNGSTDSSFEIMQRYSTDDKRFREFRKSNEGPGPGRNLAFSKLPADCEYIHFLDGDDVLYPEFLAQMTSYLDEHPEVGLVCCRFDEIDEEGNFLGRGHRSRFAPSRLGLPHDLPISENKTPFVSLFSSTGVGPFGLYRRSVFVQTDGYTISQQEDQDVFCQMCLLAEVHAISPYLYKKRQTTYNLSHERNYLTKKPVFRLKWDYYHSDDPKVNEKIVDSLKYYYKMHKPMRDFKVAIKAFREFWGTGKMRSLKWAFTCFGDGFSDLVFHKTYRRIIRKRKFLEKNPNLRKQNPEDEAWDVFETETAN